MEAGLGVGAAFVVGALVGSFLNVVVHRLPRDESLVFPSSRCPLCGNTIRPWHNLPILGYLLLRGRCRDCGGRISVRYPLVETLMGVLSAVLWIRLSLHYQGSSGHFLAALFGIYFVFIAGLVAVTFIDIDHMIIPDCLSLGGVVGGFVFTLLMEAGWKFSLPNKAVGGGGWMDSLLGAAVGAGCLLAVSLGYRALTRRDGMGMGDVKLLAAIGAFLGWKGVLFTVFVSSVVGAVVGGAAVGFRLQQAIPYGAFLSPAAVLHVFAGDEIIAWYFRVSEIVNQRLSNVIYKLVG